MEKFKPGPKPEKPKPGHPDVDLCDLRNILRHHVRGYTVPDYRDGIQYALKLIEDKIEYNKLDRERHEWARKMGME